MPLNKLEENVKSELDDNPALEGDMSDEMADNINGGTDEGQEEGDMESDEPDSTPGSALDDALEDMTSDDDMPAPYAANNNDNADYEEMVYGNATSFYDELKEQMGETNLTGRQAEIMEYLIGSLDENGWLTKDLSTISDELAIFHNIDAPVSEIEMVLKILQTFEPAGIGARDLRECLLLQIERKPKGKMRDDMLKVIGKKYDYFTRNRWDKLQHLLRLGDEQTNELKGEIRKLNPKPGASLGETMGRNTQQITPDFIIDTADDGSVSLAINNGNIPELQVSPSFVELMDTYKRNKEGMNRQAKEALLYANNKVEKARGFIEAIKQRRHTLHITMKAIIDWQMKYFQSGDEAELRPMTLKDIADKTGLNISTISRVSTIKYAQTRWGTYPVRFFFGDGYTTGEGEKMSTRKLKMALREIVSKEDKSEPLGDDQIKGEMEKQGFTIARRTVGKYREELGIPPVRLRRQ